MIKVHTPSTHIDLDVLEGVELPNTGTRYPKIRITDIAHSLANLCRFNGSTKRFYSVAEHSVLVYDRMCEEFGPDYGPPSPAWRLYALFHDAHESYLGDVIRPIKHKLLRGEMEAPADAIDLNVWRVLRIPPPDASVISLIKTLDMEVAMHEFEFVMNYWSGEKHLPAWPTCRVRFLPPRAGYDLFMKTAAKEIACLRAV